MDADDLAAIEARHQPISAFHAGKMNDYCADDSTPWPCDARILLDERREWIRMGVKLGADADALAYEAGMTAGAKEQAERIAEAVKGLLPDVDYQIKTMDGRLRSMRTPADGWEAAISAVLAKLEGDNET